MKCKVHQPFIINNHQNYTVEKYTLCGEYYEKQQQQKFSLILKTESMPTNAIEKMHTKKKLKSQRTKRCKIAL